MAKNTTNVLIILDYLLRYTDKDHMSSAKEINEYAVKEYGVTIDRRSIKDFLEELEVLNNDYRDNFGFTIKKSDGERPKYYVEDRMFKESELLVICNALKNDQFTPNELTKYLLDKLLKRTVSEHNYSPLLESLASEGNRVEKYNHTLFKKIKMVNKAIKDKCQITYSYRYGSEEKIYTDYFLKIVYIDGKPHAIIIRNNKLDTCLLDFLNIIKVEATWFDDPRSRFQISDMYEGDNAEQDIKTSKLPNPKIPTANCKFTFDNTKFSINEVCKSYKEFFLEDLTYVVKGDKCYAETTCQEDLFIKWCTSYEVAQLLTITGSKNLRIKLSMYYQVLMNQSNLNEWCIKPAESINKK